jgi:hypothetical protein
MVRTNSPTIGSTGIGPNTPSGDDAFGKPTESSGLRPKHADVARMLHSRDPDARVLDWSSAPLAVLELSIASARRSLTRPGARAGDSCFLANEQSWRTSWRARSLLSRTRWSSERVPDEPASARARWHGKQKRQCGRLRDVPDVSLMNGGASLAGYAGSHPPIKRKRTTANGRRTFRFPRLVHFSVPVDKARQGAAKVAVSGPARRSRFEAEGVARSVVHPQVERSAAFNRVSRSGRRCHRQSPARLLGVNREA